MPSLFELYELTQTLSENAHGALYRVRDKQTNALALLQRPGLTSPEAGRAQLLRESGVLSQLASVPGVAQARRLLQHRSGDALVLQYFAGVSLAERLASGPVPFETALEWAVRLAELVSAVHAAGFLHRGLGPQSFLVSGDDFCLVDFSLATPLAEERRAAGTPDPVADWGYLSPEQTGRINAGVDVRTDFYLLGLLFYSFTEGKSPFPASSPLEAVHAQLAKLPEAPQGTPETWSNLVLKLLAKAPEQRYQSHAGLLTDLRRCRDEWKASGAISAFTLAANDRTEGLRFSRRVFGRDAERWVLREAYDRAALGHREIVVLAGPSGVGKTALASEVGSWALSDQGFFLSGKYDSQRDRPYGAIIQQIEDLVRQLLLRPDLAAWKRAFAEGLKDNLAVVTALVPAFEALSGPQPWPRTLPARETENRFFYTIETFLRILREPDRMVVLFFDDLQWVDAASARLLAYLREQPDRRYLLVLYSHRTEEEPTPLFTSVREQLETSLTRPMLTLKALDTEAVGFWLDDVLGIVRSRDTLARNLVAKTAGSPFFLVQLLRRLSGEGVLWFDASSSRWDWNAASLQALPASENVSDLLIAQFKTLPPESATLLKVASCLGSTVHSGDLALFADQVPHLAEALWPLINQQYFVPHSDGYLSLGGSQTPGSEGTAPSFSVRFQHDRIRQAAYDLLSPEERAFLHLQAARRLEAVKPLEAAGHYLVVLDRLTSADERRHLTRLLTQVGRESRASSATQQALTFLRHAATLAEGLVPEKEVCDLLLLLVETAYVCHEIEEAEGLSRTLLSRLSSPEEKAEVYMVQMDAYTFLGRLDEAVDRGTQALAVLGRSLSLTPGPLRIARTLIGVMAKASRRSTEALFARQGSVPDAVRLRLRLLSKFLVPAQMRGNMNLFVLSTLMTADLALDYGNSEETSGAFGNFAILLSVLGRHRQAFEYASLAMRLENRQPSPRTAAGVHSAYSFYTLPWNRPWTEVPSAARRGADVALRSGDLFFTAYQTLFSVVFAPPSTLDETTRRLRDALQTVRATRQTDAWVGGTFALQRWRALAGELETPDYWSEEGFDEPALVTEWEARQNLSGLAVYHLYKMQVWFHMDRFEEAWESWHRLLPIVRTIHGSAYMEDYAMYAVLIAAEGARQGRRGALKHLETERRRLASWTKTAPENFGALLALAEAEELAAQSKDAAPAFQHAVTLADGTHTRWAALIHERAALWHGDTKWGRYLLADAHRLYALWGAKLKVKALEAAHPALRSGPAAAWDGDAASLWKVSQLIAREIDVDRLQGLVVQAVVENAGARRGWLLLRGEQGWTVAARGDAESSASLAGVSPAVEGIPAVFLTAAEQHEDVLVASAQRDTRFAADPLVSARKLKSVLAFRFSPPGSQLEALWYLENDLVEGAFSPERLGGLRLLSGQVGIALENARMYRKLTELNRDLEAKVHERTSELEERNRQLLSSVEYAAVLQRALLPRSLGTARDHFALWAPKDIVGGDLYWFRAEGPSNLLAVVDCTGHGVPGALITMLVHSALDEAVTSSADGDLDAVLRKANQQFRRALGQDKPDSESNDGFDIALLWWAESGPLKFAGARISLVHPSEKGLVWLHGGRRGLGYYETPENLATLVHEVPRIDGARYYLTTDGYLSQVGGEKEISFGRDRFAGLLERTSHLPMAAQGRALRHAFDEYRGERPQADDLSVIGVQL